MATNNQQSVHIDKNIFIELTPEQLQITVNILKKGSFEVVAPIINSIERQVLQQLQPAKENVPLTDVPETNGQAAS
jgi:hypothetical protein